MYIHVTNYFYSSNYRIGIYTTPTSWQHSSCFCTVEHYDHHTLPWLLFLYCWLTHKKQGYISHGTSCFDNHCCLCTVRVSAVKEEKGLHVHVRYCGMIFVVIAAILWLIVTLLVVYELILLVHTHIETGVVLSLLWSLPLSALGCKVLWKDFCTVCCDCYNPGTDSHTSCCIWIDAVSASTY